MHYQVVNIGSFRALPEQWQSGDIAVLSIWTFASGQCAKYSHPLDLREFDYVEDCIRALVQAFKRTARALGYTLSVNEHVYLKPLVDLLLPLWNRVLRERSRERAASVVSTETNLGLSLDPELLF